MLYNMCILVISTNIRDSGNMQTCWSRWLYGYLVLMQLERPQNHAMYLWSFSFLRRFRPHSSSSRVCPTIESYQMIVSIVWLQYASGKCTIPRKEMRDKKMHADQSSCHSSQPMYIYILVLLCANTDHSFCQYRNIPRLYVITTPNPTTIQFWSKCGYVVLISLQVCTNPLVNWHTVQFLILGKTIRIHTISYERKPFRAIQLRTTYMYLKTLVHDWCSSRHMYLHRYIGT